MKSQIGPSGAVLNEDTQKPTEDERNTLSSYFYLMSRLYPCGMYSIYSYVNPKSQSLCIGECAEEFQQLLKKFPPQVCLVSFTKTIKVSNFK